jgi:hypothetical protein
MSFPNLNNDLNRRLLDIYIQQYNDTLDRIDYLYRSLEFTNQRIENLTNRTSNTVRNRRNRNNNYNEINSNTEYQRPRTYSAIPNSNSNNNSNLNSNTNLNNDFTTLLSSFFFTNVIIAPTQDEINNSTSLVRYDSIENPLNESCPISLEPFHNEDQVTQINHCGHLFKTNELISWFSTNVRCPVCRYDIRNYNTTEPSRNSNININRNINSDPNNNINSSIINNLTQQLITNLLNSETYNNNFSDDRLIMDVSNNILLFETFLNPRNNNNLNN